MSSSEDTVAISEVADVNPSTPLPRSGIASFVGMEDVSEDFVLTKTHDRDVRASAGYTRFREGDLLFAKITPCMENGKGAYVSGLTNGLGFGSTEFHVLRAHDVEPGFLAQWLQADELRLAAEAQMSGSAGQRRVPTDFFKRYRIPSLSVPEQRRVTAVLDTLDDQVRASERLILKLQLAAAGFSSESFMNMLDSGVETSFLGDLLNHLIDYRGRTPRKLGMDWGGGEILALSANNVQMGGIDPAREAYFGSEALYKRWMTNGVSMCGDILITLEAPLGNIAQVPDDAKYILSQRVVLLRFNEDKFLNNFGYWYFQSQRFQRELSRNSTGTTASGIRRASLEKIRIPVPSLPEQLKISDVLFSFESRIAAERTELIKLKATKRGLMTDLLNGRVRVAMEASA